MLLIALPLPSRQGRQATKGRGEKGGGEADFLARGCGTRLRCQPYLREAPVPDIRITIVLNRLALVLQLQLVTTTSDCRPAAEHFMCECASWAVQNSPTTPAPHLWIHSILWAAAVSASSRSAGALTRSLCLYWPWLSRDLQR